MTFFVDGLTTSTPSIVALPLETGSKPAIALSSVLFPHPDAPKMQTNSPRSTPNVIFSNAVKT